MVGMGGAVCSSRPDFVIGSAGAQTKIEGLNTGEIS